MVRVLPASVLVPLHPDAAADDLDDLAAELVGAVAHAGRGHRIGDQADPVGAGRMHQGARGDRIDVDQVAGSARR